MNKQILVIDDSEKVSLLIKAILANEPIDVHSATDARYGLTMAHSVKPDLILLDVDMPELDGFSACKRLKANPSTANCPIIFLTARITPKERVRGLELGAVDYISKPFYPSELLARVRAALRTHQVIQSLEDQAWIDPLTKLGNRAMFEKRLKGEIGLSIRLETPLSVIMMDVDQFKQVNDLYGHAAGDHVLRCIGGFIAGICRAEDVACRFGGEEFVIISPHTTAAAAALLAERIRVKIQNTPIEIHRGNSTLTEDVIEVTASFGVAQSLDLYDRTMVERADLAMYQSKRAGRNRVSQAPLHLEHEPMEAA